MSGVPPSIPARWRGQDRNGPFSGPPSHRLRVVLLLSLVALLVGGLALTLPYLRPPAQSYFVPLCVQSHRDGAFAPLAWRLQDRDALVEGDYFSQTADLSASSLDQASLVRELTALRRQRGVNAVVVYLTAPARTDAAGQVQLLPADADLDDPATWLPLRRVLELLGQSAGRRRLLVLDLEPARVAPSAALLLDDVAACVPADLAAVPDRERLVLCSCAPGQTPATSEVLRRSVFGHYVEEGLRGWADASSNGRVTVRELADFVTRHVERFAQRTEQLRQTPVLLGEGSDFTLVDLPNGHPRPHRTMPEEVAYPEWLRTAWKKAAGVPGRLAGLARAEQAWREGVLEEEAQEDVRTALRLASPAAPPRPRPRSLALALDGKAPRREGIESLRQMIFQAEARTRGLPADKAGEVRKQLTEEFLKENKAAPAAELAAAAVEAAVADPRPETVRFLDGLVRSLHVQPEYVETLALRRLTAAELPSALVRQALSVVQAGARAASQPRAFAWVAARLARAAQKEHEGLVLLEASGYAPRDRAEQVLTECAAEQAGVLAEQEGVLETRMALTEASAFLPEAWRFGERARRDPASWLATAALARTLADRLAEAHGPALASALPEMRRLTELLSARLREMREPFTFDSLDALIHASRRANASVQVWHDLDGILATSLVAGSEREAAWKAALEVARRLGEEVLRLDRQNGTRNPEPAAAEGVAPEQSLEMESRIAVARLGLTGIPAALFQTLQAESDRTDRQDRATLEKQLQQAWRSLPTPDAEGKALWAWLADHYRYLERDYSALQADSAAATFYGRAALDYRPWLPPGREAFAEVIESSDPPRLLPGAEMTQVLTVRGVKPGTPQPPLHLRLFAADEEWLRFTPRELALPAPDVRSLPDGGFLVPLHVALKSAAGQQKAPMPLGLLAEVRLDGRAYHRRVMVPLAPHGPEIVLSASIMGPTPAVQSVRLRATSGRQPYALYVRNPIDKAWKKLTVRLTAGGEVRESEPFELGPRQVQRVLFPAVPSVAAPAAPATPAASPPLAEMNGPLQVVVMDAIEKKEVVSREISVDVAPPADYVEITQAQFDPTAGRNRLSVRLRLRRPLPGPPVSAELSFPPISEGGANYRDGTLRGNLSPKGDELLLFADGVRGGLYAQAIFHVKVDGWARAFAFRTTLSARSGTAAAQQLDAPAIQMRIGRFGLAGPAFTVPLEVDNAPAGATVEVSVGRLVGGAYQSEVTAQRDSPRDKKIGFTLAASGALTFEASVRDWVVGLDTGRIRGPREVQARLLDALGRELQQTSRTVVLGDTPPDGVRFVDPPAQAWRMAPLPLRARGGDAVVGIKETAFFVGKPVGDKPPEGATLVAGTALNPEKTLWGVKLPLPPTGSGPTSISVRFINAVGLSTFDTIVVNLLEADPALTAKGAITGKVVEGDRPQGGLDAVLTDEKGAEKAKVKTKDDGTFEFADVPPGKYKVSASKTSSGRSGVFPRAAQDFIDLKPGSKATVEVVLFL